MALLRGVSGRCGTGYSKAATACPAPGGSGATSISRKPLARPTSGRRSCFVPIGGASELSRAELLGRCALAAASGRGGRGRGSRRGLSAELHRDRVCHLANASSGRVVLCSPSSAQRAPRPLRPDKAEGAVRGRGYRYNATPSRCASACRGLPRLSDRRLISSPTRSCVTIPGAVSMTVWDREERLQFAGCPSSTVISCFVRDHRRPSACPWCRGTLLSISRALRTATWGRRPGFYFTTLLDDVN